MPSRVMLDALGGHRATLPLMQTQVWLRNPRTYIREVVEARQLYVVWDKGSLVKHNIDPVKFCDLQIPADQYYRMLIVGTQEQGCAELTRGGDPDKPDAVYPVWSAEDDSTALLEEILQNPDGESPATCEDPNIPREHRPVLGQEHRVVITDIPPLNSGQGRKLVRVLAELQEEYPDAIIHLHGIYSFRVMFGMGFRSVDVDARTQAAKGEIFLPNGKKISHKLAARHPKWITLCGMHPVDLEVPRNRCIYTIKSAVWAAQHFNENVNFKAIKRGENPVDTESPDDSKVVPEAARKHLSVAYQEGDKFTCNTCSVQNECKFYREGAVCSVPDSEPMKLSQFFNTRDSDTIINGLGILLSAQANRLERGLQDEQDFSEELDPEVSKMINSLFSNGVKLAKLVNPELTGGTKVGVFVNGGSGAGASVAVGNSAGQLTAAIVQELEAKGIRREDITPEMIGQVLDPNSKTTAAIAARAYVEGKDEHND